MGLALETDHPHIGSIDSLPSASCGIRLCCGDKNKQFKKKKIREIAAAFEVILKLALRREAQFTPFVKICTFYKQKTFLNHLFTVSIIVIWL